VKPGVALVLALGAVGAGAYLTFSKHGSSLSGGRTSNRPRRGGLRGPIETRELQLFCENDSQLYHQQVQPIEKNLKKKLAKGIYDRTKAEKLWGYLADNCARKYVKEFGGGVWHKMFSTSDRRAVAKAFNDSFLEENRS
jgi:hypothetical protein